MSTRDIKMLATGDVPEASNFFKDELTQLSR